MPFPRRAPARIASDLFDCIDKRNGKASKWDLIKVVGTESQFHYWLEEFLLRDKFIEEQQEDVERRISDLFVWQIIDQHGQSSHLTLLEVLTIADGKQTAVRTKSFSLSRLGTRDRVSMEVSLLYLLAQFQQTFLPDTEQILPLLGISPQTIQFEILF